MQIETRSLGQSDTVTSSSWCDPITAFIAWLAHLFDQIAKMKRVRHNTRFKPNWRDHFAALRQIEWLGDQVLAAGAARPLAGKSLYEDFDFIPSTNLRKIPVACVRARGPPLHHNQQTTHLSAPPLGTPPHAQH